MESSTTPQQMPRVSLGRSGLSTSRLSIGTWGFGSVGAAAAQAENDEAIVAVLVAAFAAGVRFLDSADAYENEAHLGELLKAANAPADVLIGTKYGHGKGFEGYGFRESVERSLSNLNLQQIPLMMIHDPRTDEDMDRILAPGGALTELRKMQTEGIVGAIGVATGTIRPLERAVESDEFDCIQFPRGYHLLDQPGRRTGLFQAARDKNMGILNPGPFAANILATGAREGALYGYRYAPPEVLEAVQKMEARCRDLNITLPAAALAFSMTEPLVDITIVGVRSQQELTWDLDALNLPVTREDLESIATIGAVDPHLLGAPTYLRPWPIDREPPKP